jgi:transcriptional regulator with XRE-family HTH domain
MKVSLILKSESKTRELLALKGHTQVSLAEAVGTSQSYINNILSGYKNPSPVLARKICEALAVEIADLFNAKSGFNSKRTECGGAQKGVAQ